MRWKWEACPRIARRRIGGRAVMWELGVILRMIGIHGLFYWGNEI